MLTQSDVTDTPVRSNSTLWFPNVGIGQEADHENQLVVGTVDLEWLQKAFYIFKFNSRLGHVQVHNGSFKRVFVDSRDSKVYSFEFYKGQKYMFEMQRRQALRARLAYLDVVLPFDIVGKGGAQGGFIFQYLRYCSPKDLFYGAGEAYTDSSTRKILEDIILLGIVPTVKNACPANLSSGHQDGKHISLPVQG